MDKKRGFIFLLILASILYFFIFTKKTDLETYLEPVKIASLNDSTQSSTKMGGYLIPLYSGSWSGYIDPQSNSLHSIKQNSTMVRISSYYQIIRSENSDWLIYDQQDNLIGNYQSTGVPILFENRIVDIHQSDGAIIKRNSTGAIEWTTWLDSTITSIDINKDYIIAGSMSGRVYLIDNEGDIIMNYQPAGSRLEIIYGASIASDSSGFAIICGLDPQRFIYFQQKENGYRPIFNQNLDSSFRRTVKISPSDDSSRFFFEGVNSLECFVIDSKSIISYLVSNRLENFFYDEKLGLVISSWKEQNSAGIDIFTEDGGIFYRDSFNQNNFFFDYVDGNIYCGIDNDLLFISIVEEDI